MSVRTFIAVECSPGVVSRAQAAIERLRAADAQVRWVAPESMHLTLKFLGDVDLTRTAAICDAVSEAAAGHSAFELQMAGLGAFPGVERPRTVWLGASVGQEEITALAGAIDEALAPLGIATEARQYKAHLTLGRVRSGRNVSQLSELIIANSEFDAGTVSVDEVQVLSSELTREGPIYQVLGRGELAGG